MATPIGVVAVEVFGNSLFVLEAKLIGFPHELKLGSSNSMSSSFSLRG